MKVIVCGSRYLDDDDLVNATLDQLRITLKARGHTLDTIIHGDMTGADALADEWANTRGIERIKHPANWTGLGRPAGPVRNRRMLELHSGGPLMVVAFPGHAGTKNMVDQAKARGIEVLEVAR